MVALAEEGNIHRAAQVLSMTQPAASKLLKDLEDMMEVPLFERLPRGMRATWYGETMIRHARMALANLNQAHDEIGALKRGHYGQVGIGAITSPGLSLLPAAVALVKQEHPSLRISLDIETSPVLLERLEQGKPHFGFDTTMPVYLGVIPRRDEVQAEDIRWFKRDNCFASHVMNAWQDGTKIHFDIPEAKNNMFPFFPDVHGAPFNGMEAMSYLTRWTVDLASNSDEFESVTKLTETAGEFPRIDDRFTGLPYRYGWMLEMDYKRPVELKGGSAGGLLMGPAFRPSLWARHRPVRSPYAMEGGAGRPALALITTTSL